MVHRTSVSGPGLPTGVMRRVGRYLTYTGRGVIIREEAAPDPFRTWVRDGGDLQSARRCHRRLFGRRVGLRASLHALEALTRFCIELPHLLEVSVRMFGVVLDSVE
jgi:hypothetical protein